MTERFDRRGKWRKIRKAPLERYDWASAPNMGQLPRKRSRLQGQYRSRKSSKSFRALPTRSQDVIKSKQTIPVLLPQQNSYSTRMHSPGAGRPFPTPCPSPTVLEGCCSYLTLGCVADSPHSGYHWERSGRLIGILLPRDWLVGIWTITRKEKHTHTHKTI